MMMITDSTQPITYRIIPWSKNCSLVNNVIIMILAVQRFRAT